MLEELTNAQKSIWVTEQYYKGSSVNNICGTAIIEEKVNFEKLEKAINIVCQKHDNFKLKLKIKNGDVKQELSENKNCKIDIFHVANLRELEKIRKEIVKKTFILENALLFKFYIFKFANGQGAFMLNIHHLIADAWTLAFICNEIIKTYSALKQNQEIETKAIYSYIDYINSEKEYLKSEKYQNDKKYWMEKYKTIPEVAVIPGSKHENINTTDIKGERTQFSVKKEEVNIIKEYCKENKISLYNFFMAIFAIYIAEITNLDDFVIGTPILNRTNYKEKNAAGMFINMAPLRINFKEDIQFKEFVKNIAIDSMSMLKHQKYSYQSLLEELRKENSNIPNLYNILLSYQITNAQMSGGDIKYKTEWTFNECSADDLDVQIYDLNDTGNLNIAYDYKKSMYSKKDIENLHNRILYIIKQIVVQDNIKIQDIDIVTKEEKEKIIDEFNKTELKYDIHKTVINLFEEQVKNNPNKIALISNRKQITYKELNQKVNMLAKYMLSKNVKKEDIVGIMLNRSPEMIIGLIAILKCGATYLPIDPEYPLDRISYMIENSETKTVLVNDNTEKYVPDGCSKINIELKNKEIYKNENIENINIDIQSDTLAYLIYTSGSTGKPKGVRITHRNLNNFVTGMKKVIDFDQNKVMVSVTTICFDIFGLEMWCSLSSGQTLVLANEEEQNTPSLLNRLCLENKVNIIQTTPSRYSAIFENQNNLDFLKYISDILVGGESVNKKVLQNMKKYSKAKIFNVYGPTETTIWSTVKELTNEKNITIGTPIANTQCYILNKNHKVLPTSVSGELYIGGDGVSKGYLKREDLNLEKFIKSPFKKNEKIYNTNDLAYYSDNGEIVHLGRTDYQVKIRGFRVELGEIENIIEKEKNIKQCVVVKKKLVNGHEALVAYYTTKEKDNINDLESKLKKELNKELPQYMIPQYFIKIDKMPHTPNGKIDRKLLPEPYIKNERKEIVKPRNELDKNLIKMLTKMLCIDNISIEDSLLELGGDSLTAITLSTKILSKFNVQVSIKDILNKYTIKDISDYINNNQSEENTKIKIEKAPLKELYPLSTSQKRIYYNSKMIGEENTVYNLPGAILVDDILDKEKVKKIFEKIIERHEILRTSFVINEDDVFQKVEDKIEFEMPVYNNKTEEIQKIIKNFSKPFALEKAPLIRVELHYIDKKKTLLLLESHHIAIDGTGLNNLIIEFNRLYNGENLKKIPIQYKDYAVWENKFNRSKNIEKYEQYWINKFKDSELSQLNLPYDYKIPANRSYKGNKISNKIDEVYFRKIERYAKKIGVSPYMFFLSVFFVLLYKYTGQNDITLGSPIANRNINETKRMIGMFGNNIVIRGKINPKSTFMDFLNEIKNQILDDLSNQPYPFDMLVKKLNIKNSSSKNPLFDVMFTYQNKEENIIKIGENNCQIIELNNDIAKFNLSLEIKPKTHTINIEYCTDLFERRTIERLYEHYINTINIIIKNVDITIKDINIISEKEKNEIVYKFNDTKMKYPKDQNIIDIFEQQLLKNKNTIAVEHNKETVTYDELNRKANALANELIEKGIDTGDVVGIYLNRSIELIISIIAVLKIGAIYMPMYIEYPEDRLEYMLKNSNAKALIYKDKMNLNFKGLTQKISSFKTLKMENQLNNKKILNSEKIAYIIYTSGTTGRPKGVQISDRNLMNFVFAFKKYYNNKIDNKDRFLATTNISFDVSMWEIFLPLLNGATLVLYEEELIQNIFSYTESIVNNQITGLYIPPNILEDVYNILKDKENIKINKILVGVEPIRRNVLSKYYNLNKDMTIVNGYGPTETTICCTALVYKNDRKDGIVPIGHPLKNDNIYILNKDQNIQPIGIPGEIFVTGDGVGKGYINNSIETSKNFLVNTLDETSTKMYKTGDIAKWNEDGTISFIGRNDSQVKISGHRIELSEINNVLMGYPGIIKSFTTTKERGNKNFIVSYYIAEKEISSKDLTIYLKGKLADYMIPNFMMQLQQFPLTANGKIDKQKLPMNFTNNSEYVEPRDEFERKIAEIFKKLFSLKRVGIDDNFFDLGGDSLLAIKFQVEALNLGLKLTYSEIFANPTIRALSENKNMKVTYKIKEKYDYTEINKLLEKNTIENIEKVSSKNKIKNVLLIGATGFLGAHILEQLILENATKIYCIVRAKSYLEPQERLKKNVEFYFGDKYNDLFGKKIIVIDGDITDGMLGQKDEGQYEDLSRNIDIVIHAAAIVKHYGNAKIFNDTNVEGTKNVIKFCEKFDKKLYYISTTSVSGNSIQKNNTNIEFKENQLYIGQDLKNIYIYTKFEAEKQILEGMQDGLKACILRVGNITNRYSDGVFQINISENAFVNRIKSIINLGVIQEEFLNHSLEFTPVDCCAQAVIKIIQDDSKFSVLHLFNNNFIKISRLLEILKDLHEEIIPVSDEIFKEKVTTILKDKELRKNISGIMTDLDENKLLDLINNIIPNSEFTQKYLKALGFEWPEIDQEYINKYLGYFKKMKYI